jgi:hypothetical protein
MRLALTGPLERSCPDFVTARHVHLAADTCILAVRFVPHKWYLCQTKLMFRVFVLDPVLGIRPRPCPVDKLLVMYPRHSRTLPFLGLDPCFPEHLKAAGNTIELIQRIDADDGVLVIFSHDTSIYDNLKFFPRSANDWLSKGWKKKGFWNFLLQLQEAHTRC